MDRHERNPERGAAAVEMALIMPLLFLLLFGVVVFGIHLFRLQSMESAVREGGRLAAIGTPLADIADRVFDEQQIVGDPAELTVTITKTVGGLPVTLTSPPCTTGDAALGARIEVTALLVAPADYGFTVPFLPGGPVAPDLTSSSGFRCET